MWGITAFLYLLSMQAANWIYFRILLLISGIFGFFTDVISMVRERCDVSGRMNEFHLSASALRYGHVHAGSLSQGPVGHLVIGCLLWSQAPSDVPSCPWARQVGPAAEWMPPELLLTMLASRLLVGRAQRPALQKRLVGIFHYSQQPLEPVIAGYTGVLVPRSWSADSLNENSCGQISWFVLSRLCSDISKWAGSEQTAEKLIFQVTKLNISLHLGCIFFSMAQTTFLGNLRPGYSYDSSLLYDVIKYQGLSLNLLLAQTNFKQGTCVENVYVCECSDVMEQLGQRKI